MAVMTPRPRHERLASANGAGAAAAAMDLRDARDGAYVVAGWLGAIIVTLLTYSGFHDIALCDFGLLLGAPALARLAAVYDVPRRSR